MAGELRWKGVQNPLTLVAAPSEDNHLPRGRRPGLVFPAQIAQSALDHALAYFYYIDRNSHLLTASLGEAMAARLLPGPRRRAPRRRPDARGGSGGTVGRRQH